MNKGAIDRGLFVLTQYKTYEECEKKGDNYNVEQICLPPENSDPTIKDDSSAYFRRKNANYNLLDETGVIKKGSKIKHGDVLVGKILVKSTKNGEDSYIDVSRVAQSDEEGIVDKVYSMTIPKGHKLVKIVVRNVKTPIVGDKLAARSAQKGTIGMIYRQEDMPFTSSGIVPDLVINPLAIPSRMTINQIIECALGKTCALEGGYGDATPFTEGGKDIVERLCNRLKKLGYESHGWETLYSGITGEQIESQIFIGPTSYQRLKHMVSNKIHARSTGRVTTLSRQPCEGRSRDGGLRFGEMERDCIIALGCTSFLTERLMKVSDPYATLVCESCGFLSNSQKECQMCKSDTIKNCVMPYITKLLIHELNSVGLKLTLKI